MLASPSRTRKFIDFIYTPSMMLIALSSSDTITSHDKKRSYLECLEEYVPWLHEQIHLVGQKPLPLERISTYRGLKNRSLRVRPAVLSRLRFLQ